MPITAPLRVTYNVATGLQNRTTGIKDWAIRVRYPRFFDQDDIMKEYNQELAHAATCLRTIKFGKFKEQNVFWAFELNRLKVKGHVYEEIFFITNEDMFLVGGVKQLKSRVKIEDIIGVVQYFYDQKENDKPGELVFVLKTQSTPVRMEIKDRKVAETILKKVVEVVKDYNEYHMKKRKGKIVEEVKIQDVSAIMTMDEEETRLLNSEEDFEVFSPVKRDY
jgi:hypothetical protein